MSMDVGTSMDVATTLESSKRQKVCEGPSNSIFGDRISVLPESIIHYILSFLPTKKAVVTSVLSSSWKFHWKFVHNLDFNDDLRHSSKKVALQKKGPFLDFVNKFFCFNSVSNIQRFSLTCRECDAAHLNEWISNAVRRRVHELILSIENPPSQFPYRFFSSESLSILKISMHIILNVPHSIHLSSLKVLHLENISFVPNQPVQEATLSCPVLEEFVLCSCTWGRIKTVNVSVPVLQRLTMEECSSDYLPDRVIKINASSLLSLKLKTYLSCEYSLCNLSSLVDVVIDIPVLYGMPDDIVLHRMRALLTAIHNVRALKLDLTAIECVSRPEFSTHVRSLSHLVQFRMGRGCSISGKKLINLLCNMPNVESLFFPHGISFYFKGNGRMLGKTPPCFLSHLKSIDIKYFRGIRDEQWFIKFLAKSVRVIDKFTIKLGSSEGWHLSTIKKFEMLVKDSKCVLEFV